MKTGGAKTYGHALGSGNRSGEKIRHNQIVFANQLSGLFSTFQPSVQAGQ